MQKRFYDNQPLNKLLVVNKPMFISSNGYLNTIKRKYRNKKAGFSGTLDPFACGCLIVAFGQYSKLFKYLNKTPKTYRAVLWLGATSHSLDIENIISIEDEKILNTQSIQQALHSLQGDITYTPPKFSAKKIEGKRAYELARQGQEVELKQSRMHIFQTKLIAYSHPFITFEATVSGGAYIRSLAQILASKLNVKGTLSFLQRLNEGAFYYDNERCLNPLDYINLPHNEFYGNKEHLYDGKKIDISDLKYQDNKEYLLTFDDFFSIISIQQGVVKYLLNKVLL
jgi:tRNA pseudouridine55 synthase